jgi:integrase/recombinase XerC
MIPIENSFPDGNPPVALSICENAHCLNSSFEVFMSGGLPVPSHSESSWLTSASLDLISQLLADKRSPVTRKEYEKDLRYFFKVISGKDQPTPELVSEFLNLDRFAALSLVLKFKSYMMIEKGLRENTVNRRLAAVRSLVSFAYKLGKCSYTLKDISNEKIQQYRDTSGVSPDLYKKVLATCDRCTVLGKRNYALLRLLWGNALRRAEVASLDVKHFDPHSRQLEILGKGKGSQRQSVTLNNQTVEAILDWLNSRAQLTPNSPLFCSLSHRQPGHRLTGTSVYNIVRESFLKAGITKVMSPHRVRHSSITAALDKSNGNVRAVQRLSRHADLRTVQLYDDNRQNLQEQITDLLEDALEDD